MNTLKIAATIIIFIGIPFLFKDYYQQPKDDVFGAPESHDIKGESFQINPEWKKK
jgi:hypothetical protein